MSWFLFFKWLERLTHSFSIEIAAFAALHNHHHVVVRVDADSPKNRTMKQNIDCWHQVNQGNFLSQRYAAGFELSKPELAVVERHALDSWFPTGSFSLAFI